MNETFDAETLELLSEIQEVRIETRRAEDAPAHRTVIWVVVAGGEAFARSVRGPDGSWYQRISAYPHGALYAEDRRIPVRAIPATGGPTVEAVSEAFRSKYEAAWPGPTAGIVRPNTLPTTLQLLPA